MGERGREKGKRRERGEEERLRERLRKQEGEEERDMPQPVLAAGSPKKPHLSDKLKARPDLWVF